jgi:hypothetical protein
MDIMVAGEKRFVAGAAGIFTIISLVEFSSLLQNL